MFKEMRRKAQQLSLQESEKILETASSGVLSLCADNDYPYGVPLSFAYSNGKIYFHCAPEGHKIDAIKSCSKASFCVIAQDSVVSKEYTTYYKSVIVFGRISIIESKAEKKAAIRFLSDKYCPNEKNADEVIEAYSDKFVMLELSAEHITGKCAKELIKK